MLGEAYPGGADPDRDPKNEKKLGPHPTYENKSDPFPTVKKNLIGHSKNVPDLIPQICNCVITREV